MKAGEDPEKRDKIDYVFCLIYGHLKISSMRYVCLTDVEKKIDVWCMTGWVHASGAV